MKNLLLPKDSSKLKRKKTTSINQPNQRKNSSTRLLLISVSFLLFSLHMSELMMLENLIHFSLQKSNYVITESKVKGFMQNVESPTFVFECMVNLKSTDTINLYEIPVIIIPSKNREIVASIFYSPGDVSIALSTHSTPLLVNPTQIRRKNNNSFVKLIFAAEYKKVTKSFDLFYLYWGSTNTNEVPNLQKQVIYSFIPFTQFEDNVLFILKVNNRSDFENVFKNVALINKQIVENDPLHKTLILGLAQFQNGIYFHMEPSKAMYLTSRSPFNHLPMMNGKFFNSAFFVDSFFSEKSQQVEWILDDPFHNFLSWDYPFVFPDDATPISLVCNFSVFLKSTDPDFLGISPFFFPRFLVFKNESTGLVFFLKIGIVQYSQQTSELSYNIRMNITDTILTLEVPMTETFTPPSYKLGIDSIQITLIPHDDTTTFCYLSVTSKENPAIQKSSAIVEIPYSFSIDMIQRVQIGMNNISDKVSKLLYVLHDIQLFHGAYFVRSVSDPQLTEAFALDQPHPVSCDSNPYLLRPVYDETFDEYYYRQLMSHPLCQDRIIGMDCLVKDCEICAESVCFVCKIPFVLENNECIEKNIQFDDFQFDVYSRLPLGDLGMAVATDTYSLTDGVLVSVDNPTGSINLEFTLDSSSNLNYLENIMINVDTLQETAMNPTTLNQGVKDLYFSEEDLHTVYFNYFKNKNPVNVKVTGRNATLKVTQLSIDCQLLKTTHFVPSQLAMRRCSSFLFENEENIYFSRLVNSSSTQHYTDNVIGSGPYKLSLACKNECDCSTSNRFLSCGSDQSVCASKYTYSLISKNPEISMCLPSCDSSCENCVNFFCSECKSDFYVTGSFEMAHQYPGVLFKKCGACHSSCSAGCAGPLPSDCFTCPDHCFFDFELKNCSCLVKAMRIFDQYDPKFDIAQVSFCPNNCIECVSENTCKKCRENYLLDDHSCFPFYRNLTNHCNSFVNNRCKECDSGYYSYGTGCKKCPAKCIECEFDTNTVVCKKCQAGTFLIDSKFCLSISVLYYLRTHQKIFLELYETNHFDTSWLSPVEMNQESVFLFFSKLRALDFIPEKKIPDCPHSHYLSKRLSCDRCPLHSKRCIGSEKIINCKEGYFLNQKTRKCVQCPENCTVCDIKKCHKCKPSFRISINKCIKCTDTNCQICLSKSVCFKCNLGYFYSNKLQKCVPCLDYCQICDSSSKCLRCFDSYLLSTAGDCYKKCEPELEYFDQKTKKCNKCSDCQFCSKPASSSCSECAFCKKKCEIIFTKKSSNSFVLSSKDVIFPSKENLKISHFSHSASSVSITATPCMIHFEIFNSSKTEITLQSVLHVDNFIFKKCSLENDISLLFYIPDHSKFTQRQKDIISITIGYSKMTVDVTVVFLSVTQINTYLFISVINLLNLNKLFSYSFIKQPVDEGLFGFLQSVFKMNNFLHFDFFKQSFTEYTFYLESTLESNIQSVSIGLVELVFYFICFVIFIYLKLFFIETKQQQLNEFIGNHQIANNLKSDQSQAMFKQLQKCLPNEHYIQLKKTQILELRKMKYTGIKLKIDNIKLSFYLNRNQFFFVFYSSFCVKFSFLSAKCIKMMFLLDATFILTTYAVVFHFLMLFPLLTFLSEYLFLGSSLGILSKNNDRREILRYVSMQDNLAQVFFSVFYVYLTILFSKKLSTEKMVTICLLLYVCYFYVQKKMCTSFKFLKLTQLLADGLILTCLFLSSLEKLENKFIAFDCFYVVINLLNIVVFFVKVIGKTDIKKVDRIIKKKSTSVHK